MPVRDFTLKEMAAQQLHKATGSQARTPAGIKALINAIKYTAKDDSLSPQEMANSLALLAGMTCATLNDYVNLLNRNK